MLIGEIKQYKADVVALQEIRMMGHRTIQKIHVGVYYSCHPDEHKFETGFLVFKMIKQLVTCFNPNRFNPVQTRLPSLHVNEKLFNYSLIFVHALTEHKYT